MIGNLNGITGSIGNWGRKTKFLSNYMDVLDLFGNEDELAGFLSFEKIM